MINHILWPFSNTRLPAWTILQLLFGFPAAWTRFILYFHHICTVNFHNYFAPAQKSSAFASIFDRNHSDSCLAVSVSHSEYTGTASLLCLYVFPITPVFGAMGCVIERHKATTVLSQQRRYDFFYFCMIRFPHHVQSSTRIPRCQSLYILI